ncbi:HlyD family type I secretion periplasmic adaptor subunit [Candidatus Halocynthiibacter alkanivorans]|uniref:HlyD family type I secretion periplasmic adaptor subunit n=1 Tax=Candidatus Halocynthiibacter alkanivorans TaxID=2267619 RepID=UPI000DF41946|nr:HlyD family type I secretion periplasmic adaptor subunit [Candidatus Halocynthiibacter alkanivorans]
MLIWLSAAALALFLLWAAFAWVDEIVRGEGEFVSSSRPQIIQNLEGGILAELFVSEGSVVEKGDVLARLEGTQFKTSALDLQDQIDALEVRRLRLEAEMAGKTTFQVEDSLTQRSAVIVASERALLEARLSDYQSRRRGASRVLKQAETEKSLMEDMLSRKVVALIEVTRARKAYSDAEIKYNEIVTRAKLERAEEYSDTLQELTSLNQSLNLANDQLNRTVITSPLRGIVNNLAVTTIGGVVRPGDEIFQIIPMGEELLVETRIKPKDIANVENGQQATVKLTAYDYTIYGSLKGEVKFISADTFEDERRDGEPYYRVTLSVDLDSLTDRQQGIEIRPGMRAQVELQTGSKTILQYLMKPLYKSQEAFRER